MPTNPSNEVAIVPIREQEVEFYGDILPAVEGPDAQIYVPLRPICLFLGLDWAGQYQRLKRDPVLGEALRTVRLSRAQTAGGAPDVSTLPLKFLPGWLFGIQASRVKPELREKILRYQRECYDVLWNAFKGDVVPAGPAPLDLSPVEQALLLAEAVASMAREHLALDQRVTTIADYTRGFIQQTKGHQARTDDRLAALELHLGSGATISEEQAAEIQVAVKNVAMQLIAQGQPNGFAQVWGELYRRYRVGAYRNLPTARYAEARAWLSTWYDELEGTAL